jgi:hypothetical protein
MSEVMQDVWATEEAARREAELMAEGGPESERTFYIDISREPEYYDWQKPRRGDEKAERWTPKE